MKKSIYILLAAIILIGVFTGCAATPVPSAPESTPAGTQETTPDTEPTAGGQLNLFTWEGMFPPEVLEGFESATGIKINYVNFDYDETMLEKLQTAKGGDYDLIIADDYIIETVISEGLAQKLDTSKLKNYSNINPAFQSRFFDPENEYTIPHGAGVQTIVYNPAAIDFAIKGYADLWNPALADNLGVVGSYRVVNGMALKTLGYSYNTENTDELNAAKDKMLELAPNIRLIKDDSLNNDLLAGEVAAAVMYTSQVTAAMLANPELKVIYPPEGIGFGIMAGFIPSNAPSADAAYAFLDFILDAQTGASCFEWLGYYSTNKEADALINDEYKSFLTLPSDIDASKMEMIQNIGEEAESQHTLIWTEFKSACGQ